MLTRKQRIALQQALLFYALAGAFTVTSVGTFLIVVIQLKGENLLDQTAPNGWVWVSIVTLALAVVFGAAAHHCMSFFVRGEKPYCEPAPPD
jgi:hypothetical protein